MIAKQDVLIVGVGGQGVVVAGNILAEAALASGYDVKKTDTLGMAQRGGNVVSQIRFDRKVFAPLVGRGQADMLIAFEKLEAARYIPFLKKDGVVIINNLEIPPLSVGLGRTTYPDDESLLEMMSEKTQNVHVVCGSKRAAEIGNPKLLNTFMLGYASRFLPLQEAALKESTRNNLPEKLHAINIRAFDEGRGDSCS